jgi:1-deoxy-D-xylulose-5-phosphate synthase
MSEEINLLDKINSVKDLRKLDKKDLPLLAKNLRHELINIVSQTGGHLGASLGVIELTIAMHYIFDTPDDKLIWDVGHQAYPHKILTGRKDKMLTIRQKNGISGFTKRSESEFDPFGAGHSSTSISAAMGFAQSFKLRNKKNMAIAVIGDGAMSAGMAYEAINNAGDLKLNNLVIILNDNDMSIDRPTGALNKYLAKLISSKSYRKVKNLADNMLNHLPRPIESTIKVAKKQTKEMLNNVSHGNNIFEHLGVSYLGPIDGHNLKDLTSILENIKNQKFTKPILLHVVTKKGKGYSPAENSECKYHGVSKFDYKTGKQAKKSSLASYTNIFSEELIRIAKKDKKVMAINAAMPSGTGLNKFAKAIENRYFDVGIAEQHAVTFAAGLAADGLKPFVAIYSTFLQRAFDQIVHDVAIQNLPVRFAIDRAGYVGEDGQTHAGSFDIAFLSILPNFIVMAASDEQELKDMVYTASLHDKSPIAFRYPRGSVTGIEKLREAKKITIGKAKLIQKGEKILILSLGTRLNKIKSACDKFLENKKVKATIIDMRFAKPIDKKIIKEHLDNHKLIITIEEGCISGFSSQVNNYLLNELEIKNKKIKNLFFPDKFLNQKSMEGNYQEIGMDEEGFYKFLETTF